MNEAIKVKVAAGVAVLFLGGIAAAGLSSRSGDATATEASALKPAVIHKRKVKTVRVPAAPVVSTAPPASVIPVSAPASAPAPVSSRTSPGGSRGDDDEGERERGEHEGGEDD